MIRIDSHGAKVEYGNVLTLGPQLVVMFEEMETY